MHTILETPTTEGWRSRTCKFCCNEFVGQATRVCSPPAHAEAVAGIAVPLFALALPGVAAPVTDFAAAADVLLEAACERIFLPANT